MILVDFNNVIFSTVSLQLGKEKLSEDLLRHVTLNCLRSYRSKYKEEFGELVLCADGHKYWRRERFPYYKAKRKMDREKSGLDWPTIFAAMDKIKAELKEFFPYKFVQLDEAEADDIIAVLANTYSPGGKLLIMGSDTDFVQLHTPNVKQYDPVRKKWVKNDDPIKYLRQHIIEGDSGDGIPNIRSPDDCFVLGERQRPIQKKTSNNWLEDSPETLLANGQFDSELFRNFKRNQELIDFAFIPDEVRLNILAQYQDQDSNPKPKRDLFGYFVSNKLVNLMGSIQDFT